MNVSSGCREGATELEKSLTSSGLARATGGGQQIGRGFSLILEDHPDMRPP